MTGTMIDAVALGASSGAAPRASEDFRALLVAALPRLRAHALMLTRNRAEADDLVQDTLERACDRWQLWTAGSDLRAWLFTLMHNLFVDGARRALRQHHLVMDEIGAVFRVVCHPPGARIGGLGPEQISQVQGPGTASTALPDLRVEAIIPRLRHGSRPCRRAAWVRMADA